MKFGLRWRVYFDGDNNQRYQERRFIFGTWDHHNHILDYHDSKKSSRFGSTLTKYNDVFVCIPNLYWTKIHGKLCVDLDHNRRVVNVVKLSGTANETFRAAIRENLPPENIVDNIHVYGYTEVLQIGTDIYFIGGTEHKEITCFNHLLVNNDDQVEFSNEERTTALTNHEMNVFLTQFLENLDYLERKCPSGEFTIQSIVISNGRLQIVCGKVQEGNLANTPGAFFAATNCVRMKSLQHDRYKPKDVFEGEVPHDNWTKHFHVCVMFLLELQCGCVIYDRPCHLDEGYRLFISEFPPLAEGILSKDPARKEDAVRDCQLPYKDRIRNMDPVLLRIFEEVLCKDQYERWPMALAVSYFVAAREYERYDRRLQAQRQLNV